MRRAAGILMMILGMVLLVTFVVVLIQYGIPVYEYAIDLLMIILAVFIVTGGILCLMKKYWGLCLASALLAVFFMIFWLMGSPYALNWLAWFFITMGTFPIIFVCLRKKEWQTQEIQG